MATGDPQDDSQQPEESPVGTSPKKSAAATSAAGLTELGKAIETLFGPAPAAPGGAMPQTQGGVRSIAGGQGGSGMSTAGAQPSGQLPPTPQRSQNAPPPQSGIPGGTPFTGGGAAVSGGITSVFGALNNIEQNKKQDSIKHAEFLYNLLKTSYEAGDQQTANVILGDNKNRKLIEKYVTGNLPRVPGSPTETLPPGKPGAPPTTNMPMPKGSVGQINQPGGVALPRPGPGQDIQAMVANLLKQRMSQGDPRAVGALAGPEQTLSPGDYEKSVRQQFGIDLTPAQVATMDANTKQTLITAKADVLKYVVGKQATVEGALEVARVHAGATVQAATIGSNARIKIAKDYRDLLVKVKGTQPDKMDQVLNKGMMDLYMHMATTSQQSAEKLQKDSPKAAAGYAQEAKDYAAKAEGMKAQYEAGQLLDDILSGKTGADSGAAEPDSTPSDNTPDESVKDDDTE